MKIVDKLRLLFGGTAELKSQLLVHRLTVQNLQIENEQLKEKVKALSERSLTNIPVAGFDTLNFEPTDKDSRQEMVATISHAYESYFESKFRSAIAEIRELLSAATKEVGMPNNMSRESYDWFLRGMEAGIWKIDGWCVLLQGERRDVIENK